MPQWAWPAASDWQLFYILSYSRFCSLLFTHENANRTVSFWPMPTPLGQYLILPLSPFSLNFSFRTFSTLNVGLDKCFSAVVFRPTIDGFP